MFLTRIFKRQKYFKQLNFSWSFCLSIIIVMMVYMPAYASPIHVTFELLENKADNTEFNAQLTLVNRSEQDFPDWQLHFNFVRPILNLEGATLLQDDRRTGDFYSIASKSADNTLSAGSQIQIKLNGKWVIKRDSDAPAGFFLTYNEAGNRSKPILVSHSSIILPDWQASTSEKAAEQKRIQAQETTETAAKRLSPVSQPLIPAPVSFEEKKEKKFVLSSSTTIGIHAKQEAGALEAANFFNEAIQPATGLKLKVKQIKSLNDKSASIIFTTHNNEQLPKPESYEIDISPNLVLIRANDPAGFHYAVQSIRQLMPVEIFGNRLQKQVKWTLPSVRIVDHPRFEYRGLHLDVARHFFDIETVKRLIDLMAIHKLNRFHWHLTDDEGWRIQIKSYPELTAVGAWRGHNHPIGPALGSGPDLYGGYYTQDQIRDLVQYAAKRQITVIPEIDMPGHARAMIKSLPHLLFDPKDKSQYESVQGYHDNVLSACIPATYQVIEQIINEVAELFPGEYIHLGSDEVPKGVWDPKKSPNCRNWMAKHRLNTAEDLQIDFIKRVKKMVEAKGKKVAGWEEIAMGTAFQGENLLVYAWQSADEGFRLAREGYDTIMAAASALYFDLAYSEDPREPGYYWAGVVDTHTTYSFQPIPPDLPSEAKANIKGVQGHLWSETIKSQNALDYMAFPRSIALSELAWSAPSVRNWDDFLKRLNETHLPRLEQYEVKYREPTTTLKLSRF